MSQVVNRAPSWLVLLVGPYRGGSRRKLGYTIIPCACIRVLLKFRLQYPKPKIIRVYTHSILNLLSVQRPHLLDAAF